MSLAAEIAELRREIDRLAAKRCVLETIPSCAAPNADPQAPPSADGVHSITPVLHEIERLVDDVVRDVDQHPRAAVLAAFGLGIAVGLLARS